MRVIYIHSSGRSGSNRFLDFFDAHPQTLSRSEVQEIDGDFSSLPMPLLESELPDDFAGQWMDAAERSKSRNSYRDRFDQTDKVFFRPGLARLGQKLMERQRFRKLTGFRAGSEWEIPQLWYRSSRREQVIPVLKILDQPQWVLRLHEMKQDITFIHNIRKPDGYLKSWWNRYVRDSSHSSMEDVFQDSMLYVPRILQYFGSEDGSRFRNFSLDALLEAELWLWRYRNELPFTQLAQSKHYKLFWYEDLSEAPVEHCREAFFHAGLEFSRQHEAYIRRMKNALFTKPHHKILEQQNILSAIERVLIPSPLWSEIEPRL